MRATRVLVRDKRIPAPLRWLAAIALLPIPGPVDEAALLLLAGLLFVFHRGPLVEAWRSSESAATSTTTSAAS
jgi:hypothetical protein